MKCELTERYETAPAVFMSKGENRELVERGLRARGIIPPDIDGVDSRRLTARSETTDWGLDRDGDMVALLEEQPDAVGFMGSDRYNELSEDTRAWLQFYPIAETAIRFAAATIPEKVSAASAKFEKEEPLVIATTYPNQAVAAIADLWQADLEETAAMVEPVYFGGSLESKPRQIPRVDAIFDVVDTGQTMRANNLIIVADQLGTLSVGAVWRVA
jgi:ATP phosphoribosyltransferase